MSSSELIDFDCEKSNKYMVGCVPAILFTFHFHLL